MTWKALLTITICAALAVSSTALIRVSLDQTATTTRVESGGLLKRCKQLVLIPALWAGILFFLLSNILWFYIIATQPLVKSYPIQLALVFLFNSIVSTSIFSEKLGVAGLLGLALILTGVAMVNWSDPAR